MNAETTFRILFWLLMAGILVMRANFMFQVRRAGERLMPDHEAVEREGRWMFIIRVVMFFILIALLISYAIYLSWIAALTFSLPEWLRWVGFALGLASLAFWAWAQTALGKHWSAQLQLRKEHHLVTTGPYARIRHPLYSAMLGIGIAFALTSANWVFVVFAAAAIWGLFMRIPREEKMMLEKFGDEYKEYMQRTGRFFPILK